LFMVVGFGHLRWATPTGKLKGSGEPTSPARSARSNDLAVSADASGGRPGRGARWLRGPRRPQPARYTNSH
jgi:hypothetical protein